MDVIIYPYPKLGASLADIINSIYITIMSWYCPQYKRKNQEES